MSVAQFSVFALDLVCQLSDALVYDRRHLSASPDLALIPVASLDLVVERKSIIYAWRYSDATSDIRISFFVSY